MNIQTAPALALGLCLATVATAKPPAEQSHVGSLDHDSFVHAWSFELDGTEDVEIGADLSGNTTALVQLYEVAPEGMYLLDEVACESEPCVSRALGPGQYSVLVTTFEAMFRGDGPSTSYHLDLNCGGGSCGAMPERRAFEAVQPDGPTGPAESPNDVSHCFVSFQICVGSGPPTNDYMGYCANQLGWCLQKAAIDAATQA